MNSECESHYPRADRERGAVEGNCVVARRGGEQPEAEAWSRTKVNSIRHVRRASLLIKGEACRRSGEAVTALELSKLETVRLGCGWSGNEQKGAWDKWRERPDSRREGLAAGRVFIVAMKPGNAGGAKGHRKTKTPETILNQHLTIAERLKRGCAIVRSFGMSTVVWRPSWERDACASRDTSGQHSFTALARYAINLSPRGKIVDWRAGCGRPACPVRREGRSIPSLPLSFRTSPQAGLPFNPSLHDLHG